MVIATVLKADNMTSHRFLNTKCLTTNNVKQIHISFQSAGFKPRHLSRKKNQQPKSQKTERISDIFYKVGQETIVKQIELSPHKWA